MLCNWCCYPMVKITNPPYYVHECRKHKYRILHYPDNVFIICISDTLRVYIFPDTNLISSGFGAPKLSLGKTDILSKDIEDIITEFDLLKLFN